MPREHRIQGRIVMVDALSRRCEIVEQVNPWTERKITARVPGERTHRLAVDILATREPVTLILSDDPADSEPAFIGAAGSATHQEVSDADA